MGLFDKLKSGLKKTRDSLSKSIDRTLASFGRVDEDFFEELEESLIMADAGVETSAKIMTELRKKVSQDKLIDPTEIKNHLKEIIGTMMEVSSESIYNLQSGKEVLLVIGVNGVGKTTTIGKMANNFSRNGKKVLLAAADTFRAGAIEQLSVWAKRAGAQIIKHNEGSDPAAVVFDSARAAKAGQTDVLICDTAGRLHNKNNLMEELAKISRVIDRELPEARKRVLLVLDATTGQNAVSQAKTFNEIIGLDGIVLTKLDGTAKGGIIIAIVSQLKIPVTLVGVGEGIDDLQEFDTQSFTNALLD